MAFVGSYSPTLAGQKLRTALRQSSLYSAQGIPLWSLLFFSRLQGLVTLGEEGFSGVGFATLSPFAKEYTVFSRAAPKNLTNH
jgi:hypothetical protein